MFRLMACASAFVAATQGTAPLRAAASVDEVLRAAGEYVAEYERQTSAVVSEIGRASCRERVWIPV